MRYLLFLACFAACPQLTNAQTKFASHPPMRPLPTPSARPLAKTPSHFVDPIKGDDAHPGSLVKPWKTLTHAVRRLKPGDTLVLRGGTYYEHVTLECSGTADQPITLRSYPGELAVLDGGFREFFESPASAWEPAPDGAPGEFRSTKTYPDLIAADEETNLLGNFGDSMVPLHGYRHRRDFRTDNVLWNFKDRLADTSAIWCGPGLYYDGKTRRIHVRLKHTGMNYLPKGDNYTGETDPRKLPLVVAGDRGQSPLTLRDVRHVRLQDLVLRGARGPTLSILDCVTIELDGIVAFGGSTAMLVRDTFGLRMIHCACRGIAAPWTFRGSLKYRAIESRLFSASGWSPTGKDNRDFEIARSEFTDSVDGVFIGNVHGVRFHHNLVDNVSDDGIFLTAGTAYDGATPGGDVHIYQNLLSRCLTTFAFGVGHGRQKALPDGALQTGSGVWIYRNIFDFRRPVMYHQPATQDGKVDSIGRFAGDHGSPTWEPMYIYHNTILADDPPRYTYGTWGLGNAMGRGAKRRVFNNIVAHLHPLPGNIFPKPDVDLQADANLFWSVHGAATLKGELFAKFRAKDFEASKIRYAPGWGARDRFADPLFTRLPEDWREVPDLTLTKASPAIDAGVALPGAWPDPVRMLDKGKPDAGALPVGSEPWHVGINGRLTMFGASTPDKGGATTLAPFAARPSPKEQRKPAAIVEGYPAFDMPLLAFALRRNEFPIDLYTRAWLDTKDYDKYGIVILVGDLKRAKITPGQYDAADLQRVAKFVENGGTLLMSGRGKQAFQSPEGQKFLAAWTGAAKREKAPALTVLAPKHPWLRHLSPETPPSWIKGLNTDERILPATKGERILGAATGSTMLYRLCVGKGQFIYIGWDVAGALPSSRAKLPTVEEERVFEEQMGILMRVVEGL